MIAAEEPLAHIAYVYDGTPEGLLTAVFQAYANHEDPEDIAQGAAFQPRLDQSVRTIETDAALAERVKRGLVRATGKAGFNAVLHASLSDDVQAGSVVYRFIRYAMRSNSSGNQRNRTPRGGPAHRTRPLGNERAASYAAIFALRVPQRKYMVCSLLSEGIGHTPAHGLVLSALQRRPLHDLRRSTPHSGNLRWIGMAARSNRHSKSP